jgi:aerobic C4-dicarboxylate transport protein
MPSSSAYRRICTSLYFQVLVAIVLGVIFGIVAPEQAAGMKPLGDGFIKLVKMLIAPIVFGTVVGGIAHMGAMKDVGRIGLRALVYFEVVSGLALAIGLVVVRTVKPGVGVAFDAASADLSTVSTYTSASSHLTTTEFLLNVIPDTIFGAFARGEVLQVLLFAILFGLALLRIGERARGVARAVAMISEALFDIVGLVMRLAPLGAFGAMAYTIGKFGLGSLVALGKLMAAVYLTCGFFIVGVLGLIALATGFSLFKLLRYISEEILIVLGTSSSESALPRIMAKLERLGCAKPVVGLVVPTGYSFNLDGTSIYMSMAAIFVAQVSGVELTLREELGILGVLLLTSKGAAGVTGSGFVTLAATLVAFPSIPMAGLTLLLGVDRFMSEARAITNLIGNAVATVVVAKWNGSLDVERMHAVLDGHAPPAVLEAEVSSV